MNPSITFDRRWVRPVPSAPSSTKALPTVTGQPAPSNGRILFKNKTTSSVPPFSKQGTHPPHDKIETEIEEIISSGATSYLEVVRRLEETIIKKPVEELEFLLRNVMETNERDADFRDKLIDPEKHITDNVTIDCSTVIKTWSKKAEKILGWKYDELVGHATMDHIIPYLVEVKEDLNFFSFFETIDRRSITRKQALKLEEIRENLFTHSKMVSAAVWVSFFFTLTFSRMEQKLS